MNFVLFYKKYSLQIASVIVGVVSVILLFALAPSAGAPPQPQLPEKAEIQEPNVYKPQAPQLPFGGSELIPKYRFVALYGSPDVKSLGSLGEQNLTDSVERVKNLAASYQPFSTEQVIPAFEIIATIAAAGPTENNDYSTEISVAKLKPWVDQAKQSGLYIMLDLQPGRNSFADQAKVYESLLLEPHVGLALDPEWRLNTIEARHLKTVGFVSSEEVNVTSRWLADLVKTNNLPPKLFMVHQFKNSMITNRESLDVSRPELNYIIHVDGFGSYGAKIETWNRTKAGLAESVLLGWKNFFDEDKPMPSPEQTMSQVPKPFFVSFQ